MARGLGIREDKNDGAGEQDRVRLASLPVTVTPMKVQMLPLMAWRVSLMMVTMTTTMAMRMRTMVVLMMMVIRSIRS